MSTTGLHELFWLVKDQYLTQEEATSLDDFQFQNYLIELAQLKPRHYDLRYLIKEVLFYLRIDSKFWAPFTRIHRKLVQTRELREGGLKHESVLVAFDIVDEVVKAAMQRVGAFTERDPIILYNQAVRDMQRELKGLTHDCEPSSKSEAQESALRLEKKGKLSEANPVPNLRSFCVVQNDIYNTLYDEAFGEKPEKTRRLVEKVVKRIKKPRLRNNLSGFERRKLRKERHRQVENSHEDEAELRLLTKDFPKLERELALDTRELRKVDYSHKLHFNPKFNQVFSLHFRLVQLVFQFFEEELRSCLPSAEACEVSCFRLQNFVMFLLVNKFELGTNDLRKPFKVFETVADEFDVSERQREGNRRCPRPATSFCSTFFGLWLKGAARKKHSTA